MARVNMVVAAAAREQPLNHQCSAATASIFNIFRRDTDEGLEFEFECIICCNFRAIASFIATTSRMCTEEEGGYSGQVECLAVLQSKGWYQ